MEAVTIKKMIEPIRKKMPRYGTEKLHLDIKDNLTKHNIKMGRDGFLKFCRAHHLLVPKTRRCFITTDSNHHYHKPPNLIKYLAPAHAEQVFVSDITYIKIEDRHAYLALVTDLYSKKVMGYKLDDNMKTSLVKEALQMAINNQEHHHQNIIHHSDRGILKYEFGLIKTIPSLEIAGKMLKESVEIYNTERRHRSLEMNTPNFAHTNQKHHYKSYKKKVVQT